MQYHFKQARAQIGDLAASDQLSKKYQTRVRNPQKMVQFAGFWPTKTGNVKKVPNAQLQGLDLGEIAFRDFPFRKWKSRK